MEFGPAGVLEDDRFLAGIHALVGPAVAPGCDDSSRPKMNLHSQLGSCMVAQPDGQ
jgi:hypothetical protein